jgi:MFS family permease
LLLAVLAVLSIGSSLTRPPVFGLLSNLTSADEQGITIGTAQSAGSLARIAGPIFAGSLYELHPAAVYVTCGSLALLTAALAWRKLRVGPPPRPAAPAA